MGKENLKKLVSFVGELARAEDGSWFKARILEELGLHQVSGTGQVTAIDEIYEYCIRKILSEQAQNFYADFKVQHIVEQLRLDYIRMEQYRRQDDFLGFCFALFQQIEAIVNACVSETMRENITKNRLQSPFSSLNRPVQENRPNTENAQRPPEYLWQLILFPNLNEKELQEKLQRPMIKWEFLERYKAVLYYYYFNKRIYNFFDFREAFFMGQNLYQIRNLNHRGGEISEKNKAIVDRVLNESHRYYFRFLGFFEDFVNRVNRNLESPSDL